MQPKRFVSLHAHTGASVFDGLGPPSDHFKFCKENGLDAHAITEHGHFNSFANAYLYIEKVHKAGDNFKYIPGIEAYVHPSLEMWRHDKLVSEMHKADKKAAQKEAKERKEKVKTEIERITDANDETEDVETSNSLTIENEDETKSGKTFNPVNRRHHMVLLPKNSAALIKLFGLSSRAYLEGMYRFPRMDLKMMKETLGNDNDVIISSACLGGFLSWETLDELRSISFDKMHSSLLDDNALLDRIVARISNTFDKYADVVGAQNVMLELQFNKLSAQDVVNRALIEFAKRNSLTQQLIATCDAHYPTPDHWRHREMYKKLGYLSYAEYNPDSLPKTKDELKAELYPKNSFQLWDEYLSSKTRNSFYDSEDTDQLICDAIERTHDIAHQVIGDISYDKSYKYPTASLSKEKSPFHLLVEMCKEGLKKKQLDSKKEYVDRLLYELSVIKKMDNAAYFLTLSRALKLAREVCLLGVARGSSGGSLVAYVLEITDLDPIKYNCRFDRFLNEHRVGAPDIDVDIANRDLVLDVLRKEFGQNNVIPISNYNTLKIKSLVKDISKFYGIPFEEVNEATKTVEQEVRKATFKHGDDKNLFILTFDDAMKHSKSFRDFIEKYPQVAESITTLFKEQRSLSRHAGGVVIMDDAPIQIPLITNGGEPQTPWVEGVGGKMLEPLGIIKYDLLGLETMRLIERSIDLIIKRKDKLFEFEMEDSSILRLFSSQKVKTQHGMKLVSDLVDDDEIVEVLE